MKLCSFVSGKRHRIGVLKDGACYDLTSEDPASFPDWTTAYTRARSLPRLLSIVSSAMEGAKKSKFVYSRLRAPFAPVEIWAAGVTYMRSREARESETKTKGLYDYVYTAERPELFVKDSGLRCVGPGDPVSIRSDSRWTVPEPELCVVLDRRFRVVGYTVGNDVSSRDIEGENPLYLPQAKVYRGSAAIGPVVATADEIPDPHSLRIGMQILRKGQVAFQGDVSTSQMKRKVGELVGYLKRSNLIGTFSVLKTGPSVVPPDDFTLQGGDVVEIEIEKIGVLRNPVRQLSQ